MADDEPGTTATVTPPAEPSKTDPPADGLGDAGKAAIAAERKRASTAEKALKAAQTKLDQIAEANQSEQEKAIDKARKEAAEAARAEVTSEYQSKVLQSEIRAQAAGKFANPALAVRLLDLDATDAFGNDGEVDATVIASAIDEFLAADGNEGLRAGSPNGGRPVGSVDAGKGSAAADTPEDAHQKFIAGVLTGRSQ